MMRRGESRRRTRGRRHAKRSENVRREIRRGGSRLESAPIVGNGKPSGGAAVGSNRHSKQHGREMNARPGGGAKPMRRIENRNRAGLVATRCGAVHRRAGGRHSAERRCATAWAAKGRGPAKAGGLRATRSRDQMSSAYPPRRARRFGRAIAFAKRRVGERPNAAARRHGPDAPTVARCPLPADCCPLTVDRRPPRYAASRALIARARSRGAPAADAARGGQSATPTACATARTRARCTASLIFAGSPASPCAIAPASTARAATSACRSRSACG
ncbi:putative brain expressed, associated with Nedd4 isoform 1 domain protein [Burkholderia pseudomallei MSHR4377]|nr:putative brain expressed, associated with Nedd4 isoform 1 domain protein [Burkholderia pseudomallei MSHR4377]